jgi:hypothetical protein
VDLTRDTEIFGAMDPYVSFMYEEIELLSEVCRNGGKHAKWEDASFNFSINDRLIDMIHIKILDKDPFKSDIIGEAEL